VPDARNDRVTIHYEIAGSGPALLFLPGLGVGIRDMRPLVEPLAEQARVITIDNRGVGRSDKPDEPYSIAQMAADAVAVLDDAGIDRIDVVGYSMGGRIALELGIEHSDRVGRLVLLATGARIVPTVQRRLLFAVAPYLKLGPKPRQPVFAFKRQRDASESYDARARLGEVHAPTLVLQGRTDRVAPPLLGEELHAGIPGSRLEWYDGGHLGPMMRPASIADTIRDFLA